MNDDMDTRASMLDDEDDDDDAFLPPGFVPGAVPMATEFGAPFEDDSYLGAALPRKSVPRDGSVDLLDTNIYAIDKENQPNVQQIMPLQIESFWLNADLAAYQLNGNSLRSSNGTALSKEEDMAISHEAVGDEELNWKLDELAVALQAEVEAGKLLMEEVKSPVATGTTTITLPFLAADEEPADLPATECLEQLKHKNMQLEADLQRTQREAAEQRERVTELSLDLQRAALAAATEQHELRLQFETVNDLQHAKELQNAADQLQELTKRSAAAQARLSNDLREANDRLRRVETAKIEVLAQLDAEKAQLTVDLISALNSYERVTADNERAENQSEAKLARLATELQQAEECIQHVSKQRDDASLLADAQRDKLIIEFSAKKFQLEADLQCAVDTIKNAIADKEENALLFEHLHADNTQRATALQAALDRIQRLSVERDAAIARHAATVEKQLQDAEVVALKFSAEKDALIIKHIQKVEQLNEAEARVHQIAAERDAMTAQQSQLSEQLRLTEDLVLNVAEEKDAVCARNEELLTEAAVLKASKIMAESEKKALHDQFEIRLAESAAHYEIHMGRLQQELVEAKDVTEFRPLNGIGVEVAIADHVTMDDSGRDSAKIRHLQRRIGALDLELNDSNDAAASSVTHSLAKIKSLQRRVGAFSATLDASDEEGEETMPYQQRRAAFESDLNEREAELATKCSTMHESNMEHHRTVRSLEGKIATLEAELLAARQAHLDSTDEICSLQGCIVSLTSKHQAQLDETTATGAAIKEYTQEKAQTIRTLQRRIGAVDSKLHETQSRNEASFEESNGIIQSLHRKIGSLESELREHEAKTTANVYEATDENARVIRSLQRQVGATRNELQASQSADKAAVEAVNKARETIRGLQRRNGALKSELRERESELKAMPAVADELRQENEQVIRSLHVRLDSAEAELLDVPEMYDKREVNIVLKASCELAEDNLRDACEREDRLQEEFAVAMSTATVEVEKLQFTYTRVLDHLKEQYNLVEEELLDALEREDEYNEKRESLVARHAADVKNLQSSLLSALDQVDNLCFELTNFREEALAERVEIFKQCHQYFMKQYDQALYVERYNYGARVKDMNDRHLAEMVGLFRNLLHSFRNEPGGEVTAVRFRREDAMIWTNEIALEEAPLRQHGHPAADENDINLFAQQCNFVQSLVVVAEKSAEISRRMQDSANDTTPARKNRKVALAEVHSSSAIQSPSSAFVSYSIANRKVEAITSEADLISECFHTDFAQAAPKTARNDSCIVPQTLGEDVASGETSRGPEAPVELVNVEAGNDADFCHISDRMTDENANFNLTDSEKTNLEMPRFQPNEVRSPQLLLSPPVNENGSTLPAPLPPFSCANPKARLDFSTPKSNFCASFFPSTSQKATTSTSLTQLSKPTTKMCAARDKLRAIESRRSNLKPPASTSSLWQPQKSGIPSRSQRSTSTNVYVTKHEPSSMKTSARRTGPSVPATGKFLRPGGSIQAPSGKIKDASQPKPRARQYETMEGIAMKKSVVSCKAKASSISNPTLNLERLVSLTTTAERNIYGATACLDGVANPAVRASLMATKPKSRVPQHGSCRKPTVHDAKKVRKDSDDSSTMLIHAKKDPPSSATETVPNNLFRKLAELKASSSSPLVSRSSRSDILLSTQKSTIKKASRTVQSDFSSAMIFDKSSSTAIAKSNENHAVLSPTHRTSASFDSQFTPLKVGHGFLDLLSPESPLLTPVTDRKRHWQSASICKSLLHEKANKDNRDFELLQRTRQEAATLAQKRCRGWLNHRKFDVLKRTLMAAAVPIQRLWRGAMVRKRYRKILDQREDAARAVILVQKALRRYTRKVIIQRRHLQAIQASEVLEKASCEQQKFNSNRLAVIKIQSLCRTFLGNCRLRKLQIAVASAVRLQKNQRMLFCRQEFRTFRRAIILLQVLEKGRQGRSKILRRRAAALCIQSYWRLLLRRREYKATRQTIALTQALSRGWIARRTLIMKRKCEGNAAILLQSIWRMRTTRVVYASTRQMALYSQAHFRGAACRRHATAHLKRLQAAVLLQACWRKMMYGKVFLLWKLSTICIQSRMLGTLEYRRYNRKKIIRIAAAEQIQKIWRMSISCKKYSSLLIKIASIQACWRGSVTRSRISKHKLELASILRIQALWRTHASETTLRAIIEGRQRKQQHDGTVAIQNFWRMVVQRYNFRKSTRGVVDLQAQFRGAISRKLAVRQRIVVQSVILIQTRWRAVGQRTMYLSNLVSARLIQAIVRGHFARRKADHQMQTYKAALRIQRFTRMIEIRQMRRRLRFGCIVLQSCARGRAARRRVAELWTLNNAALFIQVFWRKFICRHQLTQVRNASIRIQAFLRLTLVRRKAERQTIILKAITTIQSIWRALRDRRLFAAKVRAIVTLQNITQGYLARTRAIHAVSKMTPVEPVPLTETDSMTERKGTKGHSSRELWNTSQKLPFGTTNVVQSARSISNTRRTSCTNNVATCTGNWTNTENLKPPTNFKKTRSNVAASGLATAIKRASRASSTTDDAGPDVGLRKEIEKLKVADLRLELKSYGLESRTYNKLRKAELVSMVLTERDS